MNKQMVLARLSSRLKEMQERFSVRTLSIFGSIVRDEATDSSDVDILVSFETKANFDLFMDLKFYLEELLGIRVDLVTDKALRPPYARPLSRRLSVSRNIRIYLQDIAECCDKISRYTKGFTQEGLFLSNNQDRHL